MTERERQHRLKELRAEWRRWNRAWPDVDLHFDVCLPPCDHRCGSCEGCAATAYRAERLAEIEAQVARVNTGLPEVQAWPPPEPEPVMAAALALLADQLGAIPIGQETQL